MRVAETDRRARIELLFAEHSAAVLAYARRRADVATADDVLGEVFVVAWRRLDHVPADALPWLLGCARRVLANQRRGARRRRALVERLAADRLPLAPLELDDGGLAEALGSLSERDREVLRLAGWENLSPGRAAVVLGCSNRAYSMRLHRARKRLGLALEASGARVSPRTTEVLND